MERLNDEQRAAIKAYNHYRRDMVKNYFMLDSGFKMRNKLRERRNDLIGNERVSKLFRSYLNTMTKRHAEQLFFNREDI